MFLRKCNQIIIRYISSHQYHRQSKPQPPLSFRSFLFSNIWVCALRTVIYAFLLKIQTIVVFLFYCLLWFSVCVRFEQTLFMCVLYFFFFCFFALVWLDASRAHQRFICTIRKKCGYYDSHVPCPPSPFCISKSTRRKIFSLIVCLCKRYYKDFNWTLVDHGLFAMSFLGT